MRCAGDVMLFGCDADASTFFFCFDTFVSAAALLRCFDTSTLSTLLPTLLLRTSFALRTFVVAVKIVTL
jgi:hypothetical protein